MRRPASVSRSVITNQDAAALPGRRFHPPQILGEADALIRQRLKDRGLELAHLVLPSHWTAKSS